MVDAANSLSTNIPLGVFPVTSKTGEQIGAMPVINIGLDGRVAAVAGASNTAALITHAAAAAGVNGADQTNTTSPGIKIVVDITALTGTSPTLTVTLQGKDPVSGKYYTILASAALAAVATTVLTVYPGISATANVRADDVLPRTWRVISTIAGTTPAVTATVAASLLN